jgi:hypothetical protein
MSITRWPIPSDIEAAAHAMTKRERVNYLKAHGWYCLDSSGAQRWSVDGWVFTLAAATRDQLAGEAAS